MEHEAKATASNDLTYNDLKKALDIAEKQTFDLYFGLSSLKSDLSVLMEERNSKQDLRDFIQDHVYTRIDLIGESKQKHTSLISKSRTILNNSQTWKKQNNRLISVLHQYPSWRSGLNRKPTTTKDIKPWLINTFDFNDRETSLVLKIIIDSYPEDFASHLK